MGITLTSKAINSTYDSLLKLSDNDQLTGAFKVITDGLGNDTGISINNTNQVNIAGQLVVNSSITANSFVRSGGLSTQFLKADGSVDSNTYQSVHQKGLANGYAPLDGSAKISEAYLPDSIVGQLEYQGTWNATTNTPTLPSASTVKGHYYVTSVAGTYETIEYAVGDWIISNGTAWEKVDNTDAVTTVFGRIGAILANENDYSDFYHPKNEDLNANASTATTLQTARLINGTSFNGSANITTANWGTSRTITIGDTAKSLNGSTNVTWSRAELGITKTNIDALNIDADTLDGYDSSVMFKKGADIPSGADLNNYTTDGYYHQNSNSAAVAGTNYPEPLAGMLTVKSDGAMVYQTYQIYNSNTNTYRRGYYNGAWYSWKRILMDNDSINADTLDSLDSTQFLRSDADDNTGSAIKTYFGGAIMSSSARIQVNGFQRTGNIYLHSGGNIPDLTRTSDWLSNIDGDLHWSKDGIGTGKVFTSFNYSSYITKTYIDGLNVDADTLDGLTSSQFLRSDTSDTMSGTLTVDNDIIIKRGTVTYKQAYHSLYVGGDSLVSANTAIYIGNRGDGTGWGYELFYEGVGIGNDNKLKLITENLGTPKVAFEVTQDGDVTFPNNVVVEGSINIDAADLSIGAANIIFDTESTLAVRGLIWDVDGGFLSKIDGGGTNGGLVEIYTNLDGAITTGDVFRIKQGSSASTAFSMAGNGYVNIPNRLAIGKTTAPNAALDVSTSGAASIISSSQSLALDVRGGNNGSNLAEFKTTTNAVGASIMFSDNSASDYSQRGNISYYHVDTSSYGSGNAFVIGGNQTTTTILADGKLMFKEGIYLKPSSGTGAGTRKDVNWDNAYSYSQVGHLPLTGGTITGVLNVNTNDGSNPFYVTRTGSTTQALKMYVDDAECVFEAIQDENSSVYGSFRFMLDEGASDPQFDIRHGASTVVARFRHNNNSFLGMSGNVGIGTTSPSEKFSVAGSVVLGQGMNRPVIYDSDGGNFRITPNDGGWATGYLFNQFDGTYRGGFGGYGGPNTLAYFWIGDDYNDATMVIQPNAGNVGIGTSTPARKLSVNSGSDNNVAQFTSTDGLAYISFKDNSTTSDTSVALGANGDEMTFYTGTSFGLERMRIDSSGRVGIGTTSPSKTLDVNGTVRSLALLADDGTVQTGFNGNSLIQISRGAAPSYLQFISPTNQQQGILFGDTDDTVMGSVRYEHTGDYMWFQANNNERMRITSSGNVGIGTTSPDQLLSVNGNIVSNSFYLYDSTSNDRNVMFLDGSDNLLLATGTSTGARSMLFYTENAERMRITSGGNLGIGTSSPSEKLHISNGNILANQTVAKVSLGPLGTTGDVHFGASGIGSAPAVGSQDYGFYAAHNAYRTSNGAWKHSRAATIPAVRLLGSGGVSQGNQGFSFDYSPNVGTADITWSNLMQILPSGNVGIGTKSPDTKLEVVGSNALRIHDGNDKGSIFFRGDRDDVYIKESNYRLLFGAPSGMVFELDTNNNDGDFFDVTHRGSSRMYINGATGNVGIGTTSPRTKLNVSGSSADGGGVLTLENSTTATGNADYVGKIQFYGNDSGTGASGIRASIDANIQGYNGETDLVFSTAPASGANAEAMRIDQNGNVGIGTTSPADAAKLTIMGNQTFGLPGNGTNTSARFISIEGNTDGSGEGSGRVFFTEHNSTTAAMDNYGMSLGYRGGSTSIVGASGNTWTGLTQIGNGEWGMFGHDNNATGVKIMQGSRSATYTAFYSSGSETMRVTGGNLGIGTTSPDATLEVNGNIKLSSTAGLTSTPSYIWLGNDYSNGTTRDKLKIYLYNSGTEQYGFTVGSQSDIQYHSNQKHDFYVANSPKLRIDASGNVGIGTTAPAAKLQIYGAQPYIYITNTAENDAGIVFNDAQATTGQAASIQFNSGNETLGFFVNDASTERVRIQTNGDTHFSGDVVAYSTSISDERLKDNIETITNALDKVNLLRGVSYVWNEGSRKGQKDLGLIAQEVEKVLPEIVREKEMSLIDDSGIAYKTIDYEKMVGVLIEAVKELSAEVEQLKAKL